MSPFLLIFTICAGVSKAPNSHENGLWTQWRGPSRDGTVSERTWPPSFQGESLKKSWRTDLGPSYSGPLVTKQLVLVTETRDKREEVVRALDRKTGRERWNTSWKGSMTVPFFAAKNGSWIRSTPAMDGKRLYVGGMCDVLVCLDVNTGKENWQIDFKKRFGTPLPSFGFASSPLVHGDHVYVQAGASFVKLDKRTGDTVWRTLDDGGGMFGSAFSSPVLSTLQGQPQLLVQTRQSLNGVEPSTGKVLWSQPVKAFRGMNILTPTVFENGVFVSTYGGGTFFYHIENGDHGFRIKKLWSDRMQGYMSSPVVIDSHAYIHLKNQCIACFHLKTGERRWITSKRFGKYQSMVTQGSHILALDESGILYLMKANPERFELIDERRVSDSSTWAHLALAGNELFIRELNGLVAYRWSKVEPVQSTVEI